MFSGVRNKNAVKKNNEDMVVTGDKVTYNNKEYGIVIQGDIDGDGKVSSMDYVKIKNHIMEKNKLTEAIYLEAADVNEDKSITALDYIKIKNYIMSGGIWK